MCHPPSSVYLWITKQFCSQPVSLSVLSLIKHSIFTLHESICDWSFGQVPHKHKTKLCFFLSAYPLPSASVWNILAVDKLHTAVGEVVSWKSIVSGQNEWSSSGLLFCRNWTFVLSQMPCPLILEALRDVNKNWPCSSAKQDMCTSSIISLQV